MIPLHASYAPECARNEEHGAGILIGRQGKRKEEKKKRGEKMSKKAGETFARCETQIIKAVRS